MSMAQPWTEQALCKDQPPDIWFPEPGVKGSNDIYAQARTICARCPVSADCLADAIANNERHGMRAGLTPEERRLGVDPNAVPRRRRGRPKGSKSRSDYVPPRLLTPEQEIEVVALVEAGQMSIRAISRKFGVSRMTIDRTVDRVSTRVKPSHLRNACSMIGATERAAPDAASTAAEGLEPRPSGGQDS